MCYNISFLTEPILYCGERSFKWSPLYLLALEDEKDQKEDILTFGIKTIFSSLIAALYCTLNSQSLQSSHFRENLSQVATSGRKISD
jgi:hypothetical protein